MLETRADLEHKACTSSVSRRTESYAVRGLELFRAGERPEQRCRREKAQGIVFSDRGQGVAQEGPEGRSREGRGKENGCGSARPLSQAWLTEIHEYAQRDVVIMLLGNKVSGSSAGSAHPPPQPPE